MELIFQYLDYLDFLGQLTCRLKGVFHPGLADMPDSQLTSRLKGVFHPGLADMPDKWTKRQVETILFSSTLYIDL